MFHGNIVYFWCRKDFESCLWRTHALWDLKPDLHTDQDASLWVSILLPNDHRTLFHMKIYSLKIVFVIIIIPIITTVVVALL